MSRSVPEWCGKTPNTKVPDRVRVRIFERAEGKCGCCGRKIGAGESWDLEHTIALINGGAHAESNMVPWLREHHKSKTKDDMSIKAGIYSKKLAALGLKKSRWRPMPGTKRSGWKRKLDGTVERR